MFQKILKRLINTGDALLSHKVVQSDYQSRDAHCKLMTELNQWKTNECGIKIVDVKSNDRRVNTNDRRVQTL